MNRIRNFEPEMRVNNAFYCGSCFRTCTCLAVKAPNNLSQLGYAETVHFIPPDSPHFPGNLNELFSTPLSFSTVLSEASLSGMLESEQTI